MEQRTWNLEHVNVESMDKILGIPFKVLDDGFIRLIDYMGCDSSIVQAARVSYGKGTKQMSDDETLIRYLMRHRHTSPFEMCEIKLHLRVPMDCWRQWIRHRTANVNEYSTRYSIAIDSAQTTAADRWRLQSKSNKQGSAGFIDPATGMEITRKESELHSLSRQIYNDRLKMNIAREQARKDLPLSTYTEAYWKIDLHNLLHFIELRWDASAQIEIRMYAELIGREIVAKWCPITWQAFLDYRKNSITLSSVELELIKDLFSGNVSGLIDKAKGISWLKEEDGRLKPNLECQEFQEKLIKANIPIPWLSKNPHFC